MKTNRFISAKRFFALLLTVLLFTAAFCLPVSAETEGTEFTVPGTTMTVTLPEGVQVLHASTPDEDPVWVTAKILNRVEKFTEMAKNGILAEIYAFEGNCVIAVSVKESDYSKAVFNLNDLDEQQKADFVEYMQPKSNDGTTGGSVTWVEHPQIPFFCVDIHSSAFEEDMVYERLYCTLYDGALISFDLYTGASEIPEEYDALMRALVDSAVISAFKPTPELQLSGSTLWVVMIMVALVALLVGFFVYRGVQVKSEKKEKASLADRIADYRRSKTGKEDEGDGSLRFVNETMHDDVAIKVFANYHAYSRGLVVPAITILLGIVGIAVILRSGFSDNLWMILILGACVVFSAYKTATAGTTITKSLTRVFGKLRSRKAVYYFYDGDFRITGLQASNLHPYFQITRMTETKEYFYMYFGEDNAYFVKKSGFKEGDADAFRTFMKEKLGKKFK